MVDIILTFLLPVNVKNNENTNILVQYKYCNNKESNNNNTAQPMSELPAMLQQHSLYECNAAAALFV